MLATLHTTTPRPIGHCNGNGKRKFASRALALAATGLFALCVAHPAQADAPAAAKPYTQLIPGSDVSFDMVPIPAGKFKMGSPAAEKKRKPDEGPQFEVEIEAFSMGKCEVTQPEYALYLNNYQRLAGNPQPKIPADKMADAVTYPTPMYELEAGPILDRMGRGKGCPAVIMSQLAAKQYTKWLSKRSGRFYRLPTEAEWEYACRAGTTTAYSFGDDPKDLKDYGWYVDNSPLADGDGSFHKVGLKKPNPWGLYDMHGNVAEWCIDQYSDTWYKQFEGQTVLWSKAVHWPTDLYPRCIRGGGWDSEPEDCRSAARLFSTRKLNTRDPQLPQSPHWLSDGFWVGFRVIAPAKEPPEDQKLKFWEAEDEMTRKILERDREIREVIKPTAAGAVAPAPGK